MTNGRTNAFSFLVSSFGFNSSFVILSFVIPLACVSWAKISEAENGEVDDSDDPKTKQEDVSLQISHLNQPQESADAPDSATASANGASVDDPSINEGGDVYEEFLSPENQR